MNNMWLSLISPEPPQRQRTSLGVYQEGYSALIAYREGRKVGELPGRPKANHMMVARLLSGGFVERTGRGQYRTTPAGLQIIKKYEEKSTCASNDKTAA